MGRQKTGYPFHDRSILVTACWPYLPASQEDQHLNRPRRPDARNQKGNRRRHLARQLHALRSRILRSGAENLAAPRQPVRPEVVTHVLGLTRCLPHGHVIMVRERRGPRWRRATPAFCQKATAENGAERSVYWDADLPGFGLVVTSGGHRSFVVQYRSNGRSRRMKIAGVLGLSGARKQAKSLLGDVARNRDPLQERRKAAARTEELIPEDRRELPRTRGQGAPNGRATALEAENGNSIAWTWGSAH